MRAILTDPLSPTDPGLTRSNVSGTGCRIRLGPFVEGVETFPQDNPPRSKQMRTLIVTEFITLDGVVDSPGGGEHPHAGWSFKDVAFDEASYEIKGREQEEAGALLIGRVSYDEFAPVWPSMDEFATYNAMPKYVVSSTLTDPRVEQHPRARARSTRWPPSRQGDGGPILVHGSATLAQGLAAAGLVDRYHLLVFPLLLGGGKRLFAEGDKTPLALVEHAAYGNGVQLNVFDVVR